MKVPNFRMGGEQMNKQEAIERIESGAFTIEDTDLVVGLSYTKNIINQIDEQQKVTIPKFVAEWIEYCKYDKFYALHDVYANMDEELKCWRFIGNNSDVFARAWLDGYTVEQEKLYTVEIPNNGGTLVLARVSQSIKLVDGNKRFPGKFTKELIENAGFYWALKWAKEVK